MIRKYFNFLIGNRAEKVRYDSLLADNRPGYQNVTKQQLLIEVRNFERSVKAYLAGKEWVYSGRRRFPTLCDLIKAIEEHPDAESDFPRLNHDVEELHKLREFRNTLFHPRAPDSEILQCELDLPPIKGLYKRYERMNRFLTPFCFSSDHTIPFTRIEWVGERLNMSNDTECYSLCCATLDNLIGELHPRSRDRSKHSSGKAVAIKNLDYDEELLTVSIEGEPSFSITETAAAYFEDMLITQSMEPHSYQNQSHQLNEEIHNDV